jgi:Transposase IS4
MTQPYWYSGICLLLNSGFCVVNALIELRKVGVYAAAVIKKRWYWPKYIDGDAVAAHFEDKDIGSFDVLPGKLEDITFGIFAMKEPDYVMSLMATYRTDDKIELSNATRTVITNNRQSTLHQVHRVILQPLHLQKRRRRAQSTSSPTNIVGNNLADPPSLGQQSVCILVGHNGGQCEVGNGALWYERKAPNVGIQTVDCCSDDTELGVRTRRARSDGYEPPSRHCQPSFVYACTISSMGWSKICSGKNSIWAETVHRLSPQS